MAQYEGVIGPNLDWIVLKDGKELSPQRSLDVINHSPDGFSWGYGGSGPHQLALAILLEEGLNPKDAIELHHGFCGRFVARLDMKTGWTITSEELSEKMWNMAIYQGQIEQRTEHRLIKDGVELTPRRWMLADAYEHFYFSWGNAGSGAHQLAMTILVEEGLPVEEARSLHHAFCITFIAMLDSNTDWELTSNELTLQIRAVERHFGKDE